jgi:hypothetical protein
VNDDSVQIVISAQGPSQVRLRWRGAGPDVRVVVDVAPVCPLLPTGREAPTGAPLLRAPTATPTVSFELRWREAAPTPIQDVRPEPAPLATAWAAAQRLRQRAAAGASSPRRRTVRVPAG